MKAYLFNSLLINKEKIKTALLSFHETSLLFPPPGPPSSCEWPRAPSSRFPRPALQNLLLAQAVAGLCENVTALCLHTGSLSRHFPRHHHGGAAEASDQGAGHQAGQGQFNTEYRDECEAARRCGGEGQVNLAFAGWSCVWRLFLCHSPKARHMDESCVKFCIKKLPRGDGCNFFSLLWG